MAAERWDLDSQFRDVDLAGGAFHGWKGDEYQISALPDRRVAEGFILEISHIEVRNRIASLEYCAPQSASFLMNDPSHSNRSTTTSGGSRPAYSACDYR